MMVTNEKEYAAGVVTDEKLVPETWISAFDVAVGFLYLNLIPLLHCSRHTAV